MQPRPSLDAGVIAGIVGASIVMVLALLFSFFVFGVAESFVCLDEGPDLSGCLDAYRMRWLLLLAIEVASAIAAIVLWTRPAKRLAGFVVGLAGTLGVTMLFLFLGEVGL